MAFKGQALNRRNNPHREGSLESVTEEVSDVEGTTTEFKAVTLSTVGQSAG
jgi:hypothetical protein